MAAGSVHLDADGKQTLDASGKLRIHNATPDCPDCCGSCTRCVDFTTYTAILTNIDVVTGLGCVFPTDADCDFECSELHGWWTLTAETLSGGTTGCGINNGFQVESQANQTYIRVVEDGGTSYWELAIRIERNGTIQAVTLFFRVAYSDELCPPTGTWPFDRVEHNDGNTIFNSVDDAAVTAV